jgi:S1-C subfamily serine protease
VGAPWSASFRERCLVLDVVDSRPTQTHWPATSGTLTALSTGNRFFTKEDIARVPRSRVCNGMVRVRILPTRQFRCDIPCIGLARRAEGTGFCVGDRGAVLTNYHLVHSADVALTFGAE